MSLTQCQTDTNVIENLPDSPTLDTQELKRKFDEGSSGIKDFINTTLLEEIETLIATEKRNLQTIIANEKKNLLTNITEQILEDNKKKYYVGKIIMDTKNVNPATYLGFGTWQLWGTGRVPVGVNVADSNFNTVEKTGGEKTHKLTTNEMPSHGHYSDSSKYWRMGTETAETTGGPSGAAYNATSNKGWKWAKNVAPQGGGQAHNNLQPYITCYMWKRVS